LKMRPPSASRKTMKDHKIRKKNPKGEFRASPQEGEGTMSAFVLLDLGSVDRKKETHGRKLSPSEKADTRKFSKPALQKKAIEVQG